MVLNYRLHPDRAPEVYKSIGLEYSSVIIDPAAQEVLKANTATHNAAEILLRRPAIKADIQRDLTVWLAKYGVELKEASLANIRFDQNYEKAIEAKQIEEQKAEQKRYELIQAQRQAEIIAAAAKGRGDAAREEAKGVAEATRIKGDAEATYNARVSASLTQPLIQQQYLSKWDGRLPQYTFGGNAVPFVQLPVAGGGAGDGTAALASPMLERLGRLCVGLGLLWVVVIVGFWLMVGTRAARGVGALPRPRDHLGPPAGPLLRS